MDDLPPPPPYTPHDPHAPALLSPTSQRTPNAVLPDVPVRTSLRGGYIRSVEEPEEDSFSSAAAYLQERPFVLPLPHPEIIRRQEITATTTRDDMQLPIDDLLLARDVTEQDWATFTNYVIAELDANIEEKILENRYMAEEQFQECRHKIEGIFAEWNEGFFRPRNMRISPTFSFQPSGKSPSPVPSYRTTTDHAGSSASPGTIDSAANPNDFTNAHLSMHRLGPMTPGRHGAYFPHEDFSRSTQPVRGEARQASQPSLPFGRSPLGWIGGMTTQALAYAERVREQAAEQQARAQSMGNHVQAQARTYARGMTEDVRDRVVEHHNNVWRASQEFRDSSAAHRGGFRGDHHHHHSPDIHWHGSWGGRHQRPRSVHRHGPSDGHHRRSRSVSSSSSSSSGSSITSISSDDLDGADVEGVRQTFASFRLDPTKKQHLNVAVRQLRSDLRAQRKGGRKERQQQTREIKADLNMQKRAIKSEIKALVKEGRAFKKEAKRQRKAERRARKAERKADKLNARAWDTKGEERGHTRRFRHGNPRRNVDNTREGKLETPAHHREREARPGAFGPEDQVELGVIEGGRQAEVRGREADKRARAIEVEAEAREQEMSVAYEQRRKDAEARERARDKEAEAQARQIESQAEARDMELQRRVAEMKVGGGTGS
ncbi:hypothetical protein MMC06_005421 [Schaereria dolodes]|nr:hypothetical protein [Schaereria dolodes]